VTKKRTKKSEVTEKAPISADEELLRKTEASIIALAAKQGEPTPKLTRTSKRDFEQELLGNGDFEDEAIELDTTAQYQEIPEEEAEGGEEGMPQWWTDTPAGLQALEDESDSDEASPGDGNKAQFDDSDEWTSDDEWVDDREGW